MYTKVYFDGSFSSMGNFMSFRERDRIWMVLDRNIHTSLIDFVKQSTDISGSLCHFENGGIKYHISFGSPRQCISLDNSIEHFFKCLCKLTEEQQELVLKYTTVCCEGKEEPCCKCKNCTYFTEMGEHYGVYDKLEYTSTSFQIVV